MDKVLGKSYWGRWIYTKTLEITIFDTTASTLNIGDSIGIKATGNLKIAASTSAASTDTDIVTGDWGNLIATPFILSIIADDPDDLDAVISMAHILI